MAIFEIIAGLAGVGAADAVLARIFMGMYRNERRADAVQFTTTDDGWKLALHQYDPPPGVARKRPVICCHGLSGNHHGFDLTARTSMARFLAAAGHPTFVLNLRGSGLSDKGHLRGPHRLNWKLSDHYKFDAPAAIGKVLALTGADKLHWIGHSMGGMIAYAFLQSPLAEKIARCVILASPASFAHMRPVAKYDFLLKLIPAAPIKTLSASSAPLMEYVKAFQIVGGNRFLLPGHAALSAANCQDQTPTSLLLDFTRFIRAGHLVADDGTDLLEGLRNVMTPTLFMAGEADLTAGHNAVRAAYEHFGAAEKKWVSLGRAHGQATEYDHMTLLMGGAVYEEIFPQIVDWFAKSDVAN